MGVDRTMMLSEEYKQIEQISNGIDKTIHRFYVDMIIPCSEAFVVTVN